MNTQSSSSTHRNRKSAFVRWFAASSVVVVAVVVVLILASPPARTATGPTVSAVERVSTNRYFPQRLVWVGATPPREDESQLLWEALELWKATRGQDGRAELEEFLTVLTNSPWAPSLHANLGQHLQSRGQTTPALAHWQAAWEATRTLSDRNGKRVADIALAHWTRLLVLLGRTEELAAIYQAYGSRVLDRGPLTQMWLRTHEKHVRMHKYPYDSWKCGVYALDQVAQSLGLRYRRAELLRTASKPEGFSLAELQELSRNYGFGMVAVRRSTNSARLVVPSVVHWEQLHYAAIIEQRGELYRVVDPSALGVLWLTAEEINAEASGYFMVPANRLNVDLVNLSAVEAGLVFGRGSSCPPEDDEDTTCGSDEDGGCPTCPPGLGGPPGAPPPPPGGPPSRTPGGSAPGGSPPSSAPPPVNCTDCNTGTGGMPTWRVSEPYLNVWVEDFPLYYQGSKGPPIALELRYKQRDESSLGSLGLNWNGNWFSSIGADYGTSCYVYLPGGGHIEFEFSGGSNMSNPHYRNNTRLERLVDEYSWTIAFILHFPDGSQLKYPVDDVQTGGGYRLREQIDPQGNKLTFDYTYNEAVWTYLLTSITDADGNQTTVHYEDERSGFEDLVTRVSAPGNLEVGLSYDDDRQLTNVVDAVGISSSFTYHVSGYPASVTTPYGTTYFDLPYVVPGSYFDRSVIATLPDGSQHAWLMVDVYSGGDMPTDFPSGQKPASTPFANGSYPYGTLDVTNRHERNTFYWNPQQFASLGTTNFEDFTWTEFKRARIRHWLWKLSPQSFNHIDTLGHEQAPSPDGTTEGQITWYDYDGKDYDSPELRGTQVMPAVVARVMPDTTTWYTWYKRNGWGHVTNMVEKWDAGGAQYRTNRVILDSNEIDPLQVRFNPAGENKLLAGYGYDANHPHLPIRMTNALSEVTHYTYDAYDRLSSTKTPSGLLTTNIYGTDGYLKEVIDSFVGGASLRTNQYTWLNGNVRTHTDERGLTVTNFWDALNRFTGRLYPDGTTTTNLYTVGTTKILDVTATKDRLGNWDYFGYDSRRRMIAVTNANNVLTRYGYCDCGGGVSSMTNAWGTSLAEASQSIFDYQGHVLESYLPGGINVTNKYDLLGRRMITSDAQGNITNTFDNLNRLVTVSNYFGRVHAATYDNEDHVIYATDANGVTVTNYYDDLDRLVARQQPDTGIEDWGYTANVSGPTSYTNQLGKVWRYVYDPADRKTYETNANNEVIRYTYSPASDLKTLTDGKDQVTTWNYTIYGQVSNKIDQASSEILRYAYDANSRLTNRWSKAKGDTGYAYDAVGNLTNVNYPSGTTDLSFTYDPLNRATNMVDAAGTTKYEYYAGGRLKTEDGPWSSDTVTNLYNSAGLRTNLVLLQPTGTWTNGFVYDAAKRLTTVASKAGSFAYTYHATRGLLPIKVALPNSSYVTNDYDSVARLVFTKLNNSSHTTLNKHEYLYNLGNQRTRHTRTDSSYYTNKYDSIGQLVIADSTVSTEDRGYVYDAAWNLNYRTNNTTPTTFTVNNRNELTNVGGQGFSYDGNGNLTNYVAAYTSVATYDAENQLATVEETYNRRSVFTYDGRGRLRQRQDYLWAGTPYFYWYLEATVRYVYDGMRVIQERNDSNTPTVSYTRGNDLSGGLEGAGGIGGLLARSHGYSGGNWSTHNFYHADGGGNVTYLVNSSQTLAASYRYDPYGNTISSSGTLASANVYRFSSKEIIPTGNLYYYGYRFYDPNLQRWMNRDPLGEPGFELLRQVDDDATRKLDGPNLYTFVKNNCINQIDPFGLATQEKIEEIKKAIELAQRIRDAYNAAKSGKGCACLESVTAHYCNCFNKYTNGGNAQSVAQCICAANPNPDCERNALKTLNPIFKGIEAIEKAKEHIEKTL